MQLIKKIDRRKNKTGIHSSAWGLFSCSYCNKEVERHLGGGRKHISCGCKHGHLIREANTIHGEAKVRLYGIWVDMRRRCLNTNKHDYKNYGGRGIRVCAEWLEYLPFRNWAIDNGYRDDLQIDRMDNNGNYEPNNCRWTTNEINSQNTRSNRFCMSEIVELRKICKFGGFSRKRIAEVYNIGQSHLSKIVDNKIWKTNMEYNRV